jgi:hypothetical protein
MLDHISNRPLEQQSRSTQGSITRKEYQQILSDFSKVDC